MFVSCVKIKRSFKIWIIFWRTSLVQWKRWHHRLNVETLWGPEWNPTQCQNSTNVVQCCVKFSFHCGVVHRADHLPLQISNPSDTRGSFFEKVISSRRILVPFLFFIFWTSQGVCYRLGVLVLRYKEGESTKKIRKIALNNLWMSSFRH
jgi:hypothetical protein